MIRLYGSPITRAQRVMWMLEELGLEYEQLGAGVPTLLGELVPREEIERLNPSGKVPVLVDGERVLTESFGINLYLAMRYESELTPRSPEEWGQVFQWTTWVATEVERDLGLCIGLRRSGLISKAPDRLREHEAFAQWGARMALRTLEAGLASDPWLVGGRFTVADLNIASLLALAPPAGISFDDLPRVHKWLGECLARPAAQSVWGQVLKDAHALGFIGDLDVPEQP